MDRPEQVETTFPDEETLQTWENMRAEVLHELQEGGEVSDTLVDSIADLVVLLTSWNSRRRAWASYW